MKASLVRQMIGVAVLSFVLSVTVTIPISSQGPGTKNGPLVPGTHLPEETSAENSAFRQAAEFALQTNRHYPQ